MNEANLNEREDFENIVFVFDEVKIKDSLMYDKRGVPTIGFVDVGNVNNELLSFKQSCQDSTSIERQVAKHAVFYGVWFICTICNKKSIS